MEYPSSEYGASALFAPAIESIETISLHTGEISVVSKLPKTEIQFEEHHPTGAPDHFLVHGNSVSERRFVQAKRTLCDFSTGKADSAKSCESLEQFL